jgi:hypothetical protein
MEDDDLFWAMLGVTIAAVMLVAGGLFLIARPETGEPAMPPIPAAVSSLHRAPPS